MLRAIYPGSFDPVTYGHIDIMRRSCKIVDELIVGVLSNKAKIPLFSVEERVKMLKEVTKDLDNIRIVPFDGLLVEFASRMNAGLVIRGLRAVPIRFTRTGVSPAVCAYPITSSVLRCPSTFGNSYIPARSPF